MRPFPGLLPVSSVPDAMAAPELRWGVLGTGWISRNVDIVYVATPHNFHVEHGLLAIDSGKHVLIE